jgi:hypothetical protein
MHKKVYPANFNLKEKKNNNSKPKQTESILFNGCNKKKSHFELELKTLKDQQCSYLLVFFNAKQVASMVIYSLKTTFHAAV